MPPVTLLVVGSLKTSWAKTGCQQYIDRLRIDLVEVPASKQKDSAKQAEEESLALLGRLEKLRGAVWVLDERGEQMTSEVFANALSSLGDRGEPVVFVLGGAYGLSNAVRDRADRVFALSAMTLPHELCRIVALEQIYRAVQIEQGSGYHH